MSADGKVWILAAVLLLAAPLTGCAGDGDGTQSAEDDANPGTENETTDPGDTGNETEETDQAENEETDQAENEETDQAENEETTGNETEETDQAENEVPEPERGDHDGWSMAGHDAARTNYAAGETGPTEALSETWSTDHDLYEAVTDGLVLAADDEGTLVALATGNGVPVWDTDLAVGGKPAVADGTIYAFVDAEEAALVALDAETGEEQWRVAADVASDTPWRSSNPPRVAVTDGTIVSHEGSTVVARDAGTGEVSWNYTTEDRVSVAAADGTAVAAVHTNADVAISAVDLESGEESWTYEHPYDMYPSRPVVAHGHVYVTEGDDLYAFDLESGEESSTFEAGDGISGKLAVDEDHVYVGSGTHVYALDGETGEEVWRYDAGSRVSGAPIVTEAQVYASAGGALHAIEIASGEGTTISESDDRAIVPGVVVDGTVFGDDAAFTDS